MNWNAIGRVVSVLAGAAVLFGLEQGFDATLYVAIPAGLVTYAVLRAGFAYLAVVGERTK